MKTYKEIDTVTEEPTVEMTNTNVDCIVRGDNIRIVISVPKKDLASRSSNYSTTRKYCFANDQRIEIVKWIKSLEPLFLPAIYKLMKTINVSEMWVTHSIMGNEYVMVDYNGFHPEGEHLVGLTRGEKFMRRAAAKRDAEAMTDREKALHEKYGRKTRQKAS